MKCKDCNDFNPKDQGFGHCCKFNGPVTSDYEHSLCQINESEHPDSLVLVEREYLGPIGVAIYGQ